MLFDVKSSSTLDSADQRYITTVGQRRRVGFYLCICAADPTFIELIPNERQDPASLGVSSVNLQDEKMGEAVRVTRESRLFAEAHGKLDQCGSPYRMPLAWLRVAIERVRRCAQGLEDYENPWTRVRFPEWRPATTRSTKWIKPLAGTPQFTAFEEAMQVQQAVAAFDGTLTFDFLGLQPCLADFQLCLISGTERRQYFVQDKVDSRERALATPLTKVSIARGDGYYFNTMQR